MPKFVEVVSDLIEIEPNIWAAKTAFKFGYKLGNELNKTFPNNRVEARSWDTADANKWGRGRRPSRDYSNF